LSGQLHALTTWTPVQELQCILNRRLGGPQSGPGHIREDKKCPGPGGNQTSDCPAHSLVTGRGIHLHLVLCL